MRHCRTVARAFFALITLLMPSTAVYAQPTELVRLEQNWKLGWKNDGANWYHHASQGTMFMPYDWFMALEQPAAAPGGELKMFSDPQFLGQFGFLTSEKNDDYNPDNLPVGFAITDNWVDPNNTTPKPPVRVLGLTCAACHTGELVHKGRRIRIEGGSSMINIGAFQQALGQALFLTNSSSQKFQAFQDRWLKRQEIPTSMVERAKAALKEEVEKAVTKILAEQRSEAELGLHSVDAGFSRTDAMARIGNRVFGARGKMNLAASNAPVNYPHIWDAPWFYWVQYNASIRLPMVRNIGEALGVGAAINENFESTVNVKNLHLMEDQLSGSTPFSGLRAPAWPEQYLGEIKGFKTNDGLWKKGKELYKEHCIHCHYRIEDYQRTEHLNRAENKDYWSSPNQFGRKYMKQPYINYLDIGTDPSAVLEFYQRVVYTGAGENQKSTMRAGEALSILTDNVRDYEYTRLNLSAAEQAEYDGYRELDTEEAAIARLDYKARPLNGVWATAPFLHNGSVANLYELLLPAKQRMKSFHLGAKEFDTENVGFDTKWQEGRFEMDTKTPGNRNSGHEFRKFTPEEEAQLTPFQVKMLAEKRGWAINGRVGRILEEHERRELIEYVKSLGSPQPGQERAPAGEQQAIKKLAQLQALMHRLSPGPDGRPHPELRGQHPKTHGVVKARFKVADNLEERYRVGIFAKLNDYSTDPAGCEAIIRFSNGDGENDNDQVPDVHGMAIKLLNPKDKQQCQDFVLADNPTFFAKDAEHLMQFMVKVMQARRGEERESVKRELAISNYPGLIGFKKTLSSPLQTEYFSQTPYLFGDVGAKYKVAPSAVSEVEKPTDNLTSSKDGLRDALVNRLAQGNEPFQFDFYVQLQTDVEKMPIEDATIKWDSCFIKLATITIEPQSIDPKADSVSIFSPWNALSEHCPLGGINRARQAIYSESAALRKRMAEQALNNSPTPTNPAPKDTATKPDNPEGLNANPVAKTPVIPVLAPADPEKRIVGQLKKEQFGYSLPLDQELYPQFPYTYKNCTILTFEYETDPMAAAKFLPTQLTLDAKPRVKMLFASYPTSELGTYNEVAQSLICRYVDEKGKTYEENGKPVEFNYSLRMHVTSDRAMAAGREIAGIPKKMGGIDFSRDGMKYSSQLNDPAGKLVCTATMTQNTRLLQLPEAGPKAPLRYLSVRLIPGTDTAKPKVRELIDSTWKLGPGELWSGSGSLKIERSENDPYDRLPIIKLNEDNCRVFHGDMQASSLKALLPEF